ncbi:hypothetical protein WMY93_005904 [Mugilogobius chulae]|uniref:Calx-beta domain-containing protein n=1 Tax=Mugilogobius chulae TaxID=88201 RepID=A0AAW0PS67_9GOBI
MSRAASLPPLLFFLLASSQFPLSSAGGALRSNSTSNATKPKCGGSTDCIEGVILPIWEPVDPVFSERVARAVIYFLALAYMFLGVSIIADRFMASIEVITSQERQITIKKPNGERITTTVRIWNETVSNLTLMALGSSAPEILLSVVEVCGHDFQAGELGPNTIVGSAAFNMFVIIGLCVSVIPDGETRKVKHLRVFFVTAAWSVFAYLWLYVILAVFSPGVVDIWEGLLTLFFFPLCVGFAYVADRRLLFYKYVYKRYRAGKQKGMIIETEGEPDVPLKSDVEMLKANGEELEAFFEWDEEESRKEAAAILKELKQKHPEKDLEQLTELANYQCLENCGSVALNVVRQGGDLTQRIYVNFQTEDGTANAGSDYTFTQGTIVFEPGETEKEIRVEIIDDDIFEEDEHFLVHLSNVRVDSRDVSAVVGLGLPCTATVTIFDDDHAGIFTFEEAGLR